MQKTYFQLWIRGEAEAMTIGLNAEGELPRLEPSPSYQAGAISLGRWEQDQPTQAWFFYEALGLKPKEKWQYVPLKHLWALPGHQGAYLLRALALFWSQWPSAHRMLADRFQAYGQYEPENAVLFGGTFRPWHLGHTAAIESCPLRHRILIVPDRSPDKLSWHPAEGCVFQRYQALRRLSDFGGHTLAPVYPGFLALDRSQPTYLWLSHWAKKRAFLMGADQFMNLFHWARPDRLFQHLSEIYVARREVAVSELLLMKDRILRDYPGIKITVQESHPYEDLKSSQIRSSL